MPSHAFETAAARAGLRETTGLTVPAPPAPGVGRVLLHESPEGALTWHRPGAGPPATAPGRLRTFDFDPVDRAVEAFERRYRPHRLLAFGPSGTGEEVDLAALGGGAVLVLVHGTFSTAAGTFDALPETVLADLVRRYGGRVIAFEHPTVSVSPVDNVAWLDAQLRGRGAAPLRVDLLAHSRGGLLSRLLAEQPDRTGGRLEVGRAVLVATPNLGTPLASEARLGQLLDRLTTLADLLPESAATDLLEVLLTLVRQVATGALDGLEGLAAMDPGGRFLSQELNVVPCLATGTAASYAAVAADYEPAPGSALARVALDGLSDLVFGDVPNDLVVPTDGSFDVPGLAGFPISERLVFGAADGVDHDGYWHRPAFGERLLGWLTGGDAGNDPDPARVAP